MGSEAAELRRRGPRVAEPLLEAAPCAGAALGGRLGTRLHVAALDGLHLAALGGRLPVAALDGRLHVAALDGRLPVAVVAVRPALDGRLPTTAWRRDPFGDGAAATCSSFICAFMTLWRLAATIAARSVARTSKASAAHRRRCWGVPGRNAGAEELLQRPVQVMTAASGSGARQAASSSSDFKRSSSNTSKLKGCGLPTPAPRHCGRLRAADL